MNEDDVFDGEFEMHAIMVIIVKLTLLNHYLYNLH